MKLLDDLKAIVQSVGQPPPSKLFMNTAFFREIVNELVASTEPPGNGTAQCSISPNAVALLHGVEVYTSNYLPYGVVFDQDMRRIA